MSCGLPPVATSAGASGEIITDGVDGWIIHPGDWQALSQRLEVVSRDRERLLRMSLAARRRFEQFPTWEESMGKIREFLCMFS
jgi:glycosyltransferase involved in cell wall biosynthesis